MGQHLGPHNIWQFLICFVVRISRQTVFIQFFLMNVSVSVTFLTPTSAKLYETTRLFIKTHERDASHPKNDLHHQSDFFD